LNIRPSGHIIKPLPDAFTDSRADAD